MLRPRVMLAVVMGLTAPSRSAPAQQAVEQAAWLAGCWELRGANRIVHEIWTAPSGGAMVEMGRTVAAGTFADAEMVILRVEDGKLVYFASPLSQQPTKFPATTLTDTLVVFENPTHDFPKKVGYHRSGADSLHAFISGNGKTIPFNYARVRCETVLR